MSNSTSPWWMRWDTRNNRQQWWMIALPANLISGLFATVYENHETTFWAIVATVVGIVALYLFLGANVRRFHDRGKSGWWALIGLVPVIGSLWVLIECGFLKGNPDRNTWGNPA